MINIESLVEMGANVKLELTPGDLQKFAESIVERTIVAHGKVMAQESAKEETFLNTREVCAMLGCGARAHLSHGLAWLPCPP